MRLRSFLFRLDSRLRGNDGGTGTTGERERQGNGNDEETGMTGFLSVMTCMPAGKLTVVLNFFYSLRVVTWDSGQIDMINLLGIKKSFRVFEPDFFAHKYLE